MAKTLSLAALVLSALLIAAAYGSAFLPGDPPAWAAWALAVGTATMHVACMALGAARRGGIGSLAAPLAVTFALLMGGFAWVLTMDAPRPGDPLYLGLPLGAAVVLLGIGLLPLFVLPVAYALTFDRLTLGEDDLARVRDAARAALAAPAEADAPLATSAAADR